MVVSKKQGAFSYKLSPYNFLKNTSPNLILLFERTFLIVLLICVFIVKFHPGIRKGLRKGYESCLRNGD